MAPFIDYNAYPKLVEYILGLDPEAPAPLSDLTPLRLLCHSIANLVDQIQLEHIVIWNFIRADENGRPERYPAVTSVGGFRAPALQPLQSASAHWARPFPFAQYNFTIKQIEKHTQAIDIIGPSDALMLTSILKVRTLRLRPDVSLNYPQVPVQWSVNTVVVCMGQRNFTLQPTANLGKGIANGWTEIVLHPCYPFRFCVVPNYQLPLKVIFPRNTDIAMALYEVHYLLHAHPNCSFLLTLVGLEGMRQDMGNLEQCCPFVDHSVLRSMRALGPRVPFKAHIAAMLNSKYSNEYNKALRQRNSE